MDLREDVDAVPGSTRIERGELVEHRAPRLSQPPRKKEGASRRLNDRRYTITLFLLATVAFLAVVSLVFSFVLSSQEDEEDLRDLMSIIFGPLVALLGTSFAWFFARGESRS